MPFMPTDKPPYLAYEAHCAKPTEGMSLVELSAHLVEVIRLENLYLASIPKWKMAVATFATPALILTSFVAVLGTTAFFLSRLEH